MDFATWLQETFSLDASTLSPESAAKFQAIFDAEQAAAVGDVEMQAADGSAEPDADDEKKKETAVAASRRAATRLAAGRVGTDGATTAGTDPVIDEATLEKALDRIEARRAAAEKAKADAKELATLRASRAKAGPIQAGSDDSPQLRADTMTAALLRTSSMPEERVAKMFAKRGDAHVQRVMNDADGEEYRGMSLQRLFDHCIRASGETPPANREGKSFMEAARNANNKLKASGFSTLSISNILENVAQKALLDGWNSFTAVWKQFCAIRSNKDFKPHSRYSLDFTGQFRRVNPAGELQHVGLQDAKYSSQLDTFGAVVSIGRKDFINDDLGAITARMAELGMLGAQSAEAAAFTLLLAGIGTFFHANNGNYLSGGSSALSISALALARGLFDRQVTPNKMPLNVSMETLLVGTALFDTAEAIYTSEFAPQASTTAKIPQKNTYYKRFPPLMSPFLDNTSIKTQDDAGNWVAIPGQSSTVWFGFGRQGNRASHSMAFLNGAESPTVESQPNPEIQVLGEQYRAYIDYGVAEEDTRLAVCSAGV